MTVDHKEENMKKKKKWKTHEHNYVSLLLHQTLLGINYSVSFSLSIYTHLIVLEVETADFSTGAISKKSSRYSLCLDIIFFQELIIFYHLHGMLIFFFLQIHMEAWSMNALSFAELSSLLSILVKFNRCTTVWAEILPVLKKQPLKQMTYFFHHRVLHQK